MPGGETQPGVAVEVLAEAEPPLDRLLTNGLRPWGFWRESPDFPDRVWAEREFVTDDAGRVEVEPVGPGTYRVRAGRRVATATLKPGEKLVLIVD